jgi:hypothetical protein
VVRAAEAQKIDKPKRQHVKTHGQIGFVDLSKLIATRWKLLERKDRAIFDQQASLIHAEYAIKLVQWKKNNKKNEQEATTTKSAADLSTGAFRSNATLLSPFQPEYSYVSKMIDQEHKKLCMIQSLLQSNQVSIPSKKKTPWSNVFSDVVSSMNVPITTNIALPQCRAYNQRYGTRNQPETIYHGNYEEELVQYHTYYESDDSSDDYGWNDTDSMNGGTFQEPQYHHSHIVTPTAFHPIYPSEYVGSLSNQPNRNLCDENHYEDLSPLPINCNNDLNTSDFDRHHFMERIGSTSDESLFDTTGGYITRNVSIEHSPESSTTTVSTDSSTFYSDTRRLPNDYDQRNDGVLIQNKCYDDHAERVLSGI